jgi:transcriptional regulator with XRE-family HTH domain
LNVVVETDSALGAFLRARRRLADPAEFGLPDHPPRRAPGLRREEMAFLAGVSSHYYARLEQGRDRNPSPAVLDALARVLGLDEEATEHLRQLARQTPRRRRSRRAETVRPQVLRLLERWEDQPAVVLGRFRDVLATTALAPLVNPGFTLGRNLLRDTFLDPAARDVYLDWDEIAAGAVAAVRASTGADPDDPRLTELVGELSVKSERFRRLWARHDVHVRDAGVKRYRTPLVGEITLAYEAFAVVGSPGQTLYVFSAEPGSEDEHKLTLLSSLTP